jgi:hypothetical protein
MIFPGMVEGGFERNGVLTGIFEALKVRHFEVYFLRPGDEKGIPQGLKPPRIEVS